MEAYESCLGATSNGEAPWYIVPADDKHISQLIISQITLDILKGLNMTYPKLDIKHGKELREIRKALAE